MKALGSCSAVCTTSSPLHKALQISSTIIDVRYFRVTSTTASLNRRLFASHSTPATCSTDCLSGTHYSEAPDLEEIDELLGLGRCEESGLGHEGSTITGLHAKEEWDVEVSSSLLENWRTFEHGSELKVHYLEETDEEMLSKRVVNLSRANKMRSALEMYLSMEEAGLKPTPHACNSLISCILRNGSVDDALRVFEAGRRKGIVSCHGFSLVLKAVAAERGCDCALSMFFEWEEEGLGRRKLLDIIVYNTMLSISGSVRNWRAAEGMWKRLKEHGLSPTRVTYSLLISMFARCGQTDLAMSAYNEMIQDKFELDESDMKAVVAACTGEGRWNEAVDILMKMLEIGSRPNIILFNSVINCLGKAGEVDRAFKIYDLMRSAGHTPDTYTWNALLSALYRAKQYTDCLHLFSTICKKDSLNMNFHLFNTALMSCQKLGLWDRSLQILWQMEANGMQIPTGSYNLVIGACEKARKPRAALHVYEHMVHMNCPPDTFTFLSLIRACIWGSLWAEVEFILEHVEPDASLYNALIHGFCLRGKITMAKKLYTQMRDIGLEVDGRTRALMLQHMSKDCARHPRYSKRN